MIKVELVPKPCPSPAYAWLCTCRYSGTCDAEDVKNNYDNCRNEDNPYIVCPGCYKYALCTEKAEYAKWKINPY